MRHRRLAVLFGKAALLALAIGGPLVACWGPEYESVHFNDAKPDFFRMPRPWPGIPSEKRARKVSGWQYDEKAWQRPSQADALARQARAAEEAGRFAEAARRWRQADRQYAVEMDGDYVGQQPTFDREGLDDRIAALEAWREAGETASLRAYLEARDRLGKEKAAALLALKRVTAPRFAARAAYLRGAVLFRYGSAEEALQAFREAARLHPQDALAHYMVGRAGFRRVYDREPKADPEENVGLAPLSAAERTAALEEARTAYETAARVGSDPSLTRGAEGMAAACDYRLRRYPEALLRYCRMLAASRGDSESFMTWVSARNTLERMSAGDHERFQKLVLAEAEPATVYLDLHLRYGRAGAGAQYRLGLFALDVMKRHPGAAVSGRLLTRLADIEERYGRHAQSEKLSAAALERLSPGIFQDEARWQHAAALRSLDRPKEALTELEILAAGAKLPNMRRGADEAAALLSEGQKDYANAIRHYFALNYGLDYGYLVDVRATQNDLRDFLRRFPAHPQAKLVRYSLGFRQLRAGELDEAVKTFESLGAYLDEAEKKYESLTSKGQKRWPPLRTARFLAEMERKEREAKTPEGKARIAYERGRGLFHGRYELLYNGALWEGRRLFGLNPGDEVPNAEELLDRHEKEHTSLYQALLVFERIAKEYPNTPEAPKALYSAALCCTFMSNMDRFWSEQQDALTARAIGYYRRLQREYPNDPLAPAAARYGGKA